MKKLFLLFIMMILISCGGAGKESSSSGNTKIIVNETAEPKSIDPGLLTDQSGIAVNSLVSEGLTRQGKDGTPEPGLAEKWDVSEDGLTWTFHLRENIKWSSGEPVTADDFKFAWLRVLEPATASEYAYMLHYIKGGQAYNEGKGKKEDVGINVIDSRTLEVKLERPTAYFASLAASPTYAPIREKFFDEKGKNFALEADAMEYSGPYKIKSWKHDSNFIMVKNENYWNKDHIKIDEVEMVLVADSTAELNAFNNGEIELIRLTAEQYKRYEKDPRVNVFRNNSVWYLEYNMENKFLANKKIRQALTLAVDKEEMANTIVKGTGEAAYGIVPTGFPGESKTFREENGDSYPKYNPEEAKRLYKEGLAELGVTELPELSLIINEAGNNKKIAEYVQEKIRTNLGANIRIEPIPFKERMARLQQKDFEIVLSGWGSDYADPMTYIDLFVTNGGNNHSSYSNPKYDELIKIANNSSDNKVRMQAMRDAEKILGDDMPVGVMLYSTRVIMLNPKIKNVYFKGIGAEYYLYDAYVE
ncbi:MAG: peptide ABC transporter substrate-binding protein [Sebaldella sp.]|nr:peptide ABC transporter substrate-binding protein [Sebaldella sp.]